MAYTRLTFSEGHGDGYLPWSILPSTHAFKGVDADTETKLWVPRAAVDGGAGVLRSLGNGLGRSGQQSDTSCYVGVGDIYDPQGLDQLPLYDGNGTTTVYVYGAGLTEMSMWYWDNSRSAWRSPWVYFALPSTTSTVSEAPLVQVGTPTFGGGYGHLYTNVIEVFNDLSTAFVAEPDTIYVGKGYGVSKMYFPYSWGDKDSRPDRLAYISEGDTTIDALLAGTIQLIVAPSNRGARYSLPDNASGNYIGFLYRNLETPASGHYGGMANGTTWQNLGGNTAINLLPDSVIEYPPDGPTSTAPTEEIPDCPTEAGGSASSYFNATTTGVVITNPASPNGPGSVYHPVAIEGDFTLESTYLHDNGSEAGIFLHNAPQLSPTGDISEGPAGTIGMTVTTDGYTYGNVVQPAGLAVDDVLMFSRIGTTLKVYKNGTFIKEWTGFGNHNLYLHAFGSQPTIAGSDVFVSDVKLDGVFVTNWLPETNLSMRGEGVCVHPGDGGGGDGDGGGDDGGGSGSSTESEPGTILVVKPKCNTVESFTKGASLPASKTTKVFELSEASSRAVVDVFIVNASETETDISIYITSEQVPLIENSVEYQKTLQPSEVLKRIGLIVVKDEDMYIRTGNASAICRITSIEEH